MINTNFIISIDSLLSLFHKKEGELSGEMDMFGREEEGSVLASDEK